MTDAQYEAKFQEMQKYIPFLQKVIGKLKVNNIPQGDNPRKAQLQKMEMLHDLLTNKAKKLKMETLMKCEGVLIKLHAKIEKNEDAILNNIRLKSNETPSTSTTNAKDRDVEDISGPASPPPEIVIDDDIDQPVVIPTERRCSPVGVKEKPTNSHNKQQQQHHSRQDQDHRQQHHHQRPGGPHHSSDRQKPEEHFQHLREKIFSGKQHDPRGSNGGDSRKYSIPQEKHGQQRHHHDSPKDTRPAKEHHHQSPRDLNSPTLPKSSQHISKDSPTSRQSPNTTKTPAQKLQTVKVVITEPLPAHIKKQHFASYRQYPQHSPKPRESICHSNLRTLPQAIQNVGIEPAREVNEAYSPEELWEEYNESNNKPTNSKKPANTVFSRLGDKVPENSSADTSTTKSAPISIPGRYTPIPDVLKSPPLSAHDINNLLIESGANKISQDISEVGSRRPPKTDNNQEKKIESPTNSLDFVRKKLTQIAKMNSPQHETPVSPSVEATKSIEKEAKIRSPLPNERVALKYNPHPRQERLQSLSSNDGSECSTQSRINDPRLKAKLHSTNPLQNPPPTSPSNVNVLPSINFNDPRLKRQNTTTLLPPILPASNQHPAMAFTNPMQYGARKDPRISRVQSTALPATNPLAMPARRMSTTQPHYSSEENWDSDDSTRAKSRYANEPIRPRNDPRFSSSLDRNNQRDADPRFSNSFDRNNQRDIDSRFSNNFDRNNQRDIDPRLSNSLDRNNQRNSGPPNRRQSICQPIEPKENKKKEPKQQPQQLPHDIIRARPPRSDSEENWDSEPEVEATSSKQSTKTDKETESPIHVNDSPVPQVEKERPQLPQKPLNKTQPPAKTDNEHKSQFYVSPSPIPQLTTANSLRNAQLEKEGPQLSEKPLIKTQPPAKSRISSDTEEDWDAEESEVINKKPTAPTKDVPPAQFPMDRSPIPQLISPAHNQILPNSFGMPSQPPHHITPPTVPLQYANPYAKTQPVPLQYANPYTKTPSPLVPPALPPFMPPNFYTSPTAAMQQSSAANNRFSAVLNDKSERIKYFEAKKQKTTEPRTYKEFREARQKAQAQEAANRRAAQEAEAKKRAEEFKLNQDKEAKDDNNKQETQQPELTKKTIETVTTTTTAQKIQPKPQNVVPTKVSLLKDKIKATPPPPPAAESTLDKMYRTQNFNSKFPKANTSFKIPKKKTEEKFQEETKKTTNEYNITKNELFKPDEKVSNKSEKLPDNEKSINQDNVNKLTTTNKIENVANKKTAGQNIKETKVVNKEINKKLQDNKKEQEKVPEKKISDKENPQSIQNTKKEVEKVSEKKTLDKETPQSIQTTKKEAEKLQEKKTLEANTSKVSEQNSEDNNKTTDCIKNIRDPRCRPKTEIKDDNKSSTSFRDIVITSSENEVTLKPQSSTEDKNKANLDKFNKATQELTPNEEKNQAALDKFNKAIQDLSPKPQRIMRRRNTMVLFGSAPLVDKDKLMKANALLFEDVQEQEKRKRKEEEEERQCARRKKHLEEMFQKTDDNCTVSTQNIITGKRRTRATINFNETVVAMNVFKHTTKRDSTGSSTNGQTSKPTRSSSRVKTKQTEVTNQHTDTEEENDDDDDEEENKTEEVTKDEEEKKTTEKSHKEDLEESKTKVINIPSTQKKIKQNVKETKTTDEVKVIAATKQEILAKDNTNDKDEHLELTKVKTKTVKKEPTVAANKPPIKVTIKPEDNKTKLTNLSLKRTQSSETLKIDFKSIQDEEHQNCAVSSTSAETPLVEPTNQTTSSKTHKKELADNEPTSTANKSNTSTPTPEASINVLNDIVQQILKPNADRPHILGLLGQILSEDRLELIKKIIDAKQNEEEQIKEDDNIQEQKEKLKKKTNQEEEEEEKEVEQEDEDEDDNTATTSAKNTRKPRQKPPVANKKKHRTELDRLNEDIRDMFICEGVLTATGRRMCTIMGQTNNKDEESNNKKSTQNTTTPKETEVVTTGKKRGPKTHVEKARIAARTPLRRSLRSCKTNEDEEEEEMELKSTTTESTNDDTDSTEDTPPRRKMPVLKPHTPIKLPEEETPKENTENENKRKTANKPCPKSKKPKNVEVNITEEVKDNSESESEIENESVQSEKVKDDNSLTAIKNDNVHWHNQSKYINWCILCVKKLPVNTSAFHYKTHHGENYVSRLAPVLLQKFKQGKLSQPLFGVDKSPKQPSWFHRCPFCLLYFNTPMPLWLEHLQNHTAEYRYECSKCHRGSNRVATTRRHINSQCKGATMINSVVKLSVPNLIKAHVCHLCNFLQLKRANLERHLIEQHELNKKNVDLLGYTITLFDVENVVLVPENKAAVREAEAWKSIQTEEQVIDIMDDDEDEGDGIKDTEGDAVKNVEEASKENEAQKENEQDIATTQKENEPRVVAAKKEKTEKQKESEQQIAAVKEKSDKSTDKNLKVIETKKEKEEEITKSKIIKNVKVIVSKTLKESEELLQEADKEKSKSTANNQKEKTVLAASKFSKVCDTQREMKEEEEITTNKANQKEKVIQVSKPLKDIEKPDKQLKENPKVSEQTVIAASKFQIEETHKVSEKTVIAASKFLIEEENLTDSNTQKEKENQNQKLGIVFPKTQKQIEEKAKKQNSKTQKGKITILNTTDIFLKSPGKETPNVEPKTQQEKPLETVQQLQKDNTTTKAGKQKLRTNKNKVKKTVLPPIELIIIEDDEAQDVQDELLALAQQAAEEEEKVTAETSIQTEIPVEEANTTAEVPETTTTSSLDPNVCVQDELLALAQQAVEEAENATAETIKQTELLQDELLAFAQQAAEEADNATAETIKQTETPQETPVEANTTAQIAKTPATSLNTNLYVPAATHTKISDLISSSIDRIYQRNKRKSTEANSLVSKKSCMNTSTAAASNVFMPTRDESNSSPTIQILAQSIINIDEPTNQVESSKTQQPLTTSIAERLSQRFKGLQEKANVPEKPVTISIAEKLSQRFKANNEQQEKSKASESPQQSHNKPKENPFEKLFNDTVLELEKEKDKLNNTSQIELNIPAAAPPKISNDDITVISDDEDWEDIEITESAPTITSANNTGNTQKAKNKGLFQKFGMFKGNNTKTKKHAPPMVFIPKKKTTTTKDKTQPCTTTNTTPTTTSSSPTSSIKSTISSNDKTDVSTTTATNSNTTNLGFKPVINIMDDLLPDSPCNDPIDLVPELTPFEPLQDLNDISSILDSTNLSAVSINVDDNHTSMEDALDFISEQQAQDKEKTNSGSGGASTQSVVHTQGKTVINSIAHVGYSVQTSGENSFKFYCLLQNCSFLYSSDAIGLENHFLCEHSLIKWNGYCLICQAHCVSNAEGMHSIGKEIKHMVEHHANKIILEHLNNESTQHSTTSSQGSGEDRPKIKLRRLTGDCLSTANSDNATSLEATSVESTTTATTSNNSTPLSMLSALLKAKPKPPTKEMPPQPQMPLTEPLLLDQNDVGASTSTAFKNISNDFLITSVTSAAMQPKDSPLQISNVISLKAQPIVTATATTPEPNQIPKISSVRTIASKAGNLWSQQIAEERQELIESAAESLEVSQILANAGRPSTRREPARVLDDSPGPVVVSETVPVAQATQGDFVITQTVSAQYDEHDAAAVGFNISIASALTSASTPNQDAIPTDVTTPITSRQYRCMSNGCKFVSRVPVAMSDHLRFHERRNLSNKRDYFACAFCSYQSSSVEDYMKHADQYHIINKGGVTGTPTTITVTSETDTATSLTKKIHDILNSNKTTITSYRNTESLIPSRNLPQQDSEEVYLKKLRDTIEEIVKDTGKPDDKLYRCVVKNCRTQLTETTFLNHIMFHISTIGGNPNNYTFRCPHCPATYHRVAGIKAHIKNHALDRYFCYLCEQTSTNPGQLLKHFSEKHWHTLNMYTKVLLPPKTSTDGSEEILDSGYFVAYTQELSDEDVKKFGEKLILEFQRKKSGSKTHFKSSEIDLLPLPAIFHQEVNCGECEYKTKVRTNMYRHLLMHKQNPGLANHSGQSKVVDPVNPVPCLNSTERFFDKMTNLASSSLIPSSTSSSQTNSNTTTKPIFKMPYSYVLDDKRFTCGCPGCSFILSTDATFREHLTVMHSNNMSFRCPFCQEDVCKKGISIEKIFIHSRLHVATIYRCEECNYLHHLRYVVERHINDKHATLKVNVVTHERTREDNMEGTTSSVCFKGKKYKEISDSNQQPQTSTSAANTRSSNSESSILKPSSSSASSNTAKGKGKWICDLCNHKASTLAQIQTHCQQQHGQKNQYQCAHCNFGSQQLSLILYHIDEKHPGKTREARHMYHKVVSANDEAADTRPLWQRNDPTRVRHIRGILMEDEEESEEYRKKLGLSEDNDDDDDEEGFGDMDVINTDYISGYEFGCYHCDFKTQTFDDLKIQHYQTVHNTPQETAKPFWYRLHRRLCCPECRQFIGNCNQLQNHLMLKHNTNRYCAADITIAETDDHSQRLLCAYCSYHCATVELLYRHYVKARHMPMDVRIDNNEQIMDILKLGKSESSYVCTLCTDIFPNTVAIVEHACNAHAGEESFSFRELSNSLIHRCFYCLFTSTTEMDLLRHMIDHYSGFKKCYYCPKPQTTFTSYMQHWYAEHRSCIGRFKDLYPFAEIEKFLLHMLIVFPSGLILNKRNLLKTKYGKSLAIESLYEEIYKISQQPPIPRLSIARLVARKSIEAQQKHIPSPVEMELLKPLQPQAKKISKRRCTVAVSLEDIGKNAHNANLNLTNETTLIDVNKQSQKPKKIAQRRQSMIVDSKNSTSFINTPQQQQQHNSEFNAPLLQPKKISKRRCTVAVDHETPCHSHTSSSPYSLLIERDVVSTKKRKISSNTPSPSLQDHPLHYPSNLDMEPFSYYGQTPEAVDLSKIHTKIAIGGIQTPLTLEKFKQLVNIECQLELTKCDPKTHTLDYIDYKHIKKACPASHKIRYT